MSSPRLSVYTSLVNPVIATVEALIKSCNDQIDLALSEIAIQKDVQSNIEKIKQLRQMECNANKTKSIFPFLKLSRLLDDALDVMLPELEKQQLQNNYDEYVKLNNTLIPVVLQMFTANIIAGKLQTYYDKVFSFLEAAYDVFYEIFKKGYAGALDQKTPVSEQKATQNLEALEKEFLRIEAFLIKKVLPECRDTGVDEKATMQIPVTGRYMQHITKAELSNFIDGFRMFREAVWEPSFHLDNPEADRIKALLVELGKEGKLQQLVARCCDMLEGIFSLYQSDIARLKQLEPASKDVASTGATAKAPDSKIMHSPALFAPALSAAVVPQAKTDVSVQKKLA